MNRFGLSFHHFGLAVSKPEKALLFLQNIGYQIGTQVFDEMQKVNLIMCNGCEMPDVELIFPSETEGPLDKMLAERKEMIYHICYSTPSITSTVEQMRESGIRLVIVSPPKPAILFDNRFISFYQAVGFGLIEFLEL